METTEYTADYFIEFYEAIPYDLWITGLYTDQCAGKTCCCALGHLGVTGSTPWPLKEGDKANALINLFKSYLRFKPHPNKSIQAVYLSVMSVNDGDTSIVSLEYPELYDVMKPLHPKDRILAALKLIKEKISQEAKVPE